MAKIIIQGSEEENSKAFKALKETFNVVSLKSVLPIDNEKMTVLELYANKHGFDGFSDEEIDKALYCCSCIDKLCSLCPYLHEDGCEEKLKLDGAVYVSRLFRR